MRADDAIARKILVLRTKAGLSQRELAKLVGTTASVICRLEDADYGGHSLPMLNRIAKALNKRVEIRFVSLGRVPVSVVLANRKERTGKPDAAAILRRLHEKGAGSIQFSQFK